MNISVTKDNVVIIEKSDAPHENEYKITKCYFTFDDFTEPFQVKRAIFTILSTGEMYETDIVNNECYVPVDVLKHELETIKVGVYGYNIEIVNEKETLKERFSPSYTTFVVPSGSYEEGAVSPTIITPTQYDLYSQALQEGLAELEEGLEEVSHVDIDANKSDKTTTVTITNRHNEEKTVEILDGEDGYTPVKGVDYFTTEEIEEIEGTVKEQVKTDLDFDNTVNRINQDIQDLNTNKASKTELEEEITARELADTNLQSQIDAIESGKDVVDIVATYSDLQNYDTSTLTEDDVIKVLDDSTHNNAMSYYRWASNTWNYIGSEGPFYTKSETNSLLNTKQTTIDSSHKLSSDLVDDTNQTNKFTSTNEKNTWNAKYDKPNTGIPKSDLVASVQESLNKADTAIQDVSDKEDKSNKVTEINSSSTDTQYPSAKCVYDSQEEQNEHIAELEMLYNAFPTVSDEDTTIQLDNTAKVKFREIDLKGNTSQVVIPEEQGTSVSNTSIYVSDVNTDKENTIEMSGNTYQNSTTGKNLLPPTLATDPNYTKGTTTTYDSNTGYYTTTGTTTNTYPWLVDANVSISTGTTLTISSNFSYRIYARLYYNSSSYEEINSATTPTKTVSNDIIRIAILSNTPKDTQVNETYYVQIEEGSTATSFEKFTYGASPNPSYPQNIEVVTGENDVKIEGKNLFKASSSNYKQGLTITYDSDTGEITFGGTTTGGYPTLSNYTNTYIPAGTYTFSIDKTLPYTIGCRFRNASGQYPTTISIGSGELSKTITTTYDAVRLELVYSATTSGITIPETTIKPMIEKSSTATTFEPYVSQTYPINLGNIELCKISTYQDRIYKSNNKWYLEKKVGKVVLNGTETGWFKGSDTSGNYYINSNIVHSISNYIDALSNYFINAKGYPSNRAGLFAIRDGGNSIMFNSSETSVGNWTTWLGTHNTNVYYPQQTSTTEITDSTLVSQLNALYNATIYPITNINTDTSNLLPYIDLHYNFVTPSPSPSRPSVVNVVKGENTITISNSDNTESQNYPINLGDMELCKIGTYQDYIYESNGNWYKYSEIGNITLDGSEDENITIDDVALGTNYRSFNLAGRPTIPSSICYCDKLLYQENSIYTNDIQGIKPNSIGDIKMKVLDSSLTTVTAFKNWLSNNNLLIYYALATPTDTQITDTTLITQLNNIKKAYSYDTQTNISQTNTDKPFIIYAEAIRSLKDVFE